MSEPMTVTEAAEMLGCSPRTVQRLVAAGELPYLKKLAGPNGAYLLSRSDVLERMLKQQQPKTA